jgi:hypothetical protein
MNISQAEKLFLRMEEQIQNRLCSNNDVPQEPECEVHSDAQSGLQEQLYEMCSLRDLFVKQSQALALLQQQPDEETRVGPVRPPATISTLPTGFDEFSASSIIDQEPDHKLDSKSFDDTLEEITNTLEASFMETMREMSPTYVTKLSVYQDFFDDVNRTLDFDDESDEIDSTALNLDGTDSEIQAAINKIRKEASRMDTVIALDQLNTLQTELEVVTKALHERSVETEDLRIQLEEMEERVACLELERDLYKADTGKLQDDLKTCVERMFDISCVAGESSLDPNSDSRHPEPAARDQNIVQRVSEGPEEFDFPIIAASKPVQSAHNSYYHTPVKSAPKFKPGSSARRRVTPEQARAVIRRISCASNPVILRNYDTNSSTDAVPLMDNARPGSIFRGGRRKHVPESEAVPSLSDKVSQLGVSRPPPKRRHKSFSALSAAKSRGQQEEEPEGKENRRCGIFRCKQQRGSSSRTNDITMMRQQIDQLHSMMKSSLSTSEKLRKRLAMISRYYEGIIQKLQEQAAEIKAEKSRLKVDLDNKISTIDHDKRVTIIHLESKLRQRDEEVARLKKKITRSNNEI